MCADFQTRKHESFTRNNDTCTYALDFVKSWLTVIFYFLLVCEVHLMSIEGNHFILMKYSKCSVIVLRIIGIKFILITTLMRFYVCQPIIFCQYDKLFIKSSIVWLYAFDGFPGTFLSKCVRMRTLRYGSCLPTMFVLYKLSKQIPMKII